MNTNILNEADQALHDIDIETRRKQQEPLRNALQLEAEKLAMWDELVETFASAHLLDLDLHTWRIHDEILLRARALQARQK